MNNFYNRITHVFNPYKGLSREIYILFIARIINTSGSFISPLLTLILTKKLGYSSTNAGLLMSCAGILYMMSSLLSGKLVDSFGRKKLVIIFTTLSASFYILAGIIGPSKEIIPFIIIAGALSNMSWPAHGAITADLTTPENRKATYSLFYMGMNIGFSISPLIGGFLFEKYLRVLFIGDAITTLISTLLIFLFIDETFDKSKKKVYEKRSLEKNVDGSIFKVLLSRPILILYALIMFGYNFVYSQWTFLYPIHLEHIFTHNGAFMYGKLTSFNALIVIFFTPLLTSIISKFKDLKVIFFGGILYAIGFGMIGFVDTEIAFICSVCIFTVGEIIVTTNSMPFIVNHTPASHRGRMNSVLPLIMGMGQTLGPVIMGRFIGFSSISSGWKLTGAVMIIFAIFMYFLDKYNLQKYEVKSNTSQISL